MLLPTLTLLLDDGSGTFPHNISSFVMIDPGYSFNRGRDDWQASVTAGSLSLSLNNSDGRFTPGSTVIASPSPIRVDQGIRLQETVNGVTYTRFTGHVTSWRVAWPAGVDSFSVVQITATDAQARAERRVLRSVIEEEFLLDSPDFMYVLKEPFGLSGAADTSGNQCPPLMQAGSGSTVDFGRAYLPGTDSYNSAYFTGGKYFVPSTMSDTIRAATVHEVIFAINVPPATRLGLVPYFPLWTPNNISYAVCMETTGQLLFSSHTTATNYADTEPHHLVYEFTTGDIYIDGVFITTDGSPGNIYNEAPFNKGSLAYLTGYATGTGPSAARIAAHSAAAITGFEGESGTARLTRLAGYANIPIGTFDASLTNVPFDDIGGTSAADAIRQVAIDGEGGLAVIDGSGDLVFHNRNRAAGKTTPDITIAATHVKTATEFTADLESIINYCEATLAGRPPSDPSFTDVQLTQIAWDSRSELGDGTATYPGHGRYSTSISCFVQTDAEALDRASWIVANFSEPRTRAGALVIDLLTMTPAQQAQVLAIEPNTWVRVTGLPSQTPDGTTADVVVQGFIETVNSREWSLTCNVSSRALYSAWILGDSTYSILGSTTRLYI